MTITTWIIAIAVALLLLFLAVKFIKSCLPKIIIGIIILAAIAYAAYWYFTR